MIFSSKKHKLFKNFSIFTDDETFYFFFALRFSPGNCSSNNMITNCLNSHHFGVKCVWDNEKAICLPFSEIPVIPPSIDFESTYR